MAMHSPTCSGVHAALTLHRFAAARLRQQSPSSKSPAASTLHKLVASAAQQLSESQEQRNRDSQIMLPSRAPRLSSGGMRTCAPPLLPHAASNSSSNSRSAHQQQQHQQWAPTPADLRAQHQALAGQLQRVLSSPEQPREQQVAAAAGLVLQGSTALTASPDWQLLQQALGQAAARRNSQAASSATARPAGGFGFALRQPGGARPQAPSPPPAAGQQQQQQQQQQWAWPAVQRLLLLGLGSVSACCSSGGGSNSAEAAGRLPFRFGQLALAHALAGALPGLDAAPLAYDPAYDDWDAQLLTSLGFCVAAQQPSWSLDSPSLLYTPCCPREMYEAVLAANWGSSERLQRLAILGSSMRSLADTQGLLQALVTQGGGAGGSGMQAMPVVQQAYAQGRVIEMPCPDCAAHGVAVAVHLFLPRR